MLVFEAMHFAFPLVTEYDHKHFGRRACVIHHARQNRYQVVIVGIDVIVSQKRHMALQ